MRRLWFGLGALVLSPLLDARPQALSPDNLERKKEGPSVVGLPFANYSTDAGFGLGGGAYWFESGTRMLSNGVSNREYFLWPYQARIGLQIFLTTLGQQRHFLNLDLPRLGDDRLALNVEIAYLRYLADAYYGRAVFSTNAVSASPLGYNTVTTEGLSLAAKVRWDLSDFLNLGGEWKTKRWGVKSRQGTLTDDGQRIGVTRFDVENPSGAQGGWIHTASLRLSIDRRDFAPYPTRGFLLTSWWDLSPPAVSDFAFTRFGVEADAFAHPWNPLVLALRLRGVRNFGDAPFFEWNGLGGNADLRGFAWRRFTDDATVLANAEARLRFLQWAWGREHFDLAVTPFADAGRAGSAWFEPGPWHLDAGFEFLLTWNLATHLNVTWGWSAEGLNFAIDTRLMF